MEDVIIARALHVLGVVLWIGGVAFVTLVLLPAIRRLEEPGQRVMLFERLENRFAWQARATTLIVGASGFYMTAVWDLWNRFSSVHYWWMHAMALIWVLFTVMLFVAEPLFLHGWFLRKAEESPKRMFRLIERLHWVLLTVSLITVAGAVAGSHGLTF
jgi:uncharacterized membrane protein